MSSPDLPQAERPVETGAGVQARPRGAGPALRPASFRLRRLALALPTMATAALIAALAVAAYGPPDTWLGRGVLGLFVVLMAWQSFTAWQYIYGLVAALMGDRALSALERRAATISTRPTGLSRTAAVVAIHAEDPIAVFSAIRVMARSLQREGGDGSDIDIFVLSDTREGAISAVEEHEFARIQAWARREGRGMPRIRYRRRTENTGRKAGNIAEFCETYGPEYDFMIVLDADSLMTGAAMRRLARLMEENPRLGLIQTVSYAAGRDTLFARIQQFAVRLYAPLSLRCLETWQGPDGSYWGHNAILRVEAFANNAELPVLSGKPPLGGEILCHDIVEGALLRRAGWEVRLLPEMGGTWEEMPTNLIDLLGRERRWCQGNLQHIRVLPMKGLLGASRWHLGVGILGYCVYPLWIAFLGLGTWQAARSGELGLIGYGIDGASPAAWALAALVIAVMALPKLLSLGYVLASRERRADFGGAASLLVSAALEQVIWVLLWPVMALFAAGAVVTTFFGRVVRWDSQARDDRSVPWSEAIRLQSDAIAAGGALAVMLVVSGDTLLALWMAPVALALLTSPAQSVLTSSTRLGLASKASGLFLTQDDTRPAPELVELHQGRIAGPAAITAGDSATWLPAAIDEAGAPTLH
ncbi:MAG TPA: glucans biosynthesis glucosyltransferase MdoH [Methylorubrum populi]|uniref:Glucans biosynthesis glucosyltransferase H n=1 Tax=Methylorubrum populi TaxID=223967 RepID=A0A921E5N8_9HYPH|nr:glucans biosynthesis glucosyltransferase MdoH [Methylorubrum populi]